MDIIIKFGYRTYVFHSKQDVNKATSIYAHNIGNQDSFENELEQNNIDFEYEID